MTREEDSFIRYLNPRRIFCFCWAGRFFDSFYAESRRSLKQTFTQKKKRKLKEGPSKETNVKGFLVLPICERGFLEGRCGGEGENKRSFGWLVPFFILFHGKRWLVRGFSQSFFPFFFHFFFFFFFISFHLPSILRYHRHHRNNLN